MSGLANVKLHLVNNIDQAAAMKRWLGERRPVLGLDTETEGFSWVHDRVRLIQIGDANTGWAIPWEGWGGAAIECLREYDGPIVMHNAKFDTHMIEQWCGWEIPRHRVDDTMVMAHILEPTMRVGLKDLTRRFVDSRAAHAQRTLDEGMTKNGWTWGTVPMDFEPYWAYGALDTVLTSRLWELLKPKIDTDARAAYDLEMGRTWVVQRQERNGCKIDVDFTREKLRDFEAYVESSAEWCKTNYGVSPGSNPKVVERLRADGVEVPDKRTPSGAQALDREVLEGIIASTGHPLAEVVLQRRRLQKLASAYLSNFLKHADSDGVLHPNVRVLGARTGRESITDPALQTLPRRSAENAAAITVRDCIVGRTEDHTLLMCDFDQIEMRLFGHLSQDAGLIEAFNDGDFFTNVARELYADDTLQKSDSRRQFTKNGMYALGYGAGAEKIALTTGRPVSAVQEFLALLELRFPGIKQLQQRVGDTAHTRMHEEGVPYVRSPLTRRKHIADDGKEYALVNFLIQGMAAEIFKTKTIELAAAGLDEYIILGVHDEVVLDVPNDVFDDVADAVARTMNDDKLLSVPITAGLSRGYRWGQIEDME